jgi:hypothetical protein
LFLELDFGSFGMFSLLPFIDDPVTLEALSTEVAPVEKSLDLSVDAFVEDIAGAGDRSFLGALCET